MDGNNLRSGRPPGIGASDEALYLTYFEKMSVDEIRKITGKSARQIYKLASRGRASLREKLEGMMGFDDA